MLPVEVRREVVPGRGRGRHAVPAGAGVAPRAGRAAGAQPVRLLLVGALTCRCSVDP